MQLFVSLCLLCSSIHLSSKDMSNLDPVLCYNVSCLQTSLAPSCLITQNKPQSSSTIIEGCGMVLALPSLQGKWRMCISAASFHTLWLLSTPNQPQQQRNMNLQHPVSIQMLTSQRGSLYEVWEPVDFTVSSCGIPIGLFCFCCLCTRHTHTKRQMLKENSEFWTTGCMYVSFRQSKAGLLSQECYFSPNPPKSTFHRKLKERKRASCWNYVQAWISQTWPRLKAQRQKPFVYVDMVNYL